MADENEKDVKKTAENFIKDIGDKLGHSSENKDNAQQQDTAATGDNKSDVKDKIVGAVKDEAEKIVKDKGKDIVGDVENLFKGKK